MLDNELKIKVQHAVDHRLSGLEGDPWLARRIINGEKGERPVMKKKISVSILAMIIALLLTMSAAFALVHSNIAGTLFGSQENAPQELLDQIHTPQETASTALGVLTIDEWLYDGKALHTSLTIANPTQETLLYTLDGIWLNDERITYDISYTDGAADSGFLLGGMVDVAEMPSSHTLYNRGSELYRYDENGQFQGYADLPEGKATLKASFAVWRPLRQPELVDYKQYEGVDVTETKDHLIAGENGRSELWLFRPDKYDLVTYADQLPSEVYAEAYSELGWAELVDTVEVEIEVYLSKDQVSRVQPRGLEYENGSVRLVLDTFDMSHAGGEVSGWVYGEAEAVSSFMQDGLCLVDMEGKRLLSCGCFWDDQAENAEGVYFTIRLSAIRGELPAQVSIVPTAATWERGDDPFMEMPEDIAATYDVDYSREICIDLVKSK